MIKEYVIFGILGERFFFHKLLYLIKSSKMETFNIKLRTQSRSIEINFIVGVQWLEVT